MNAKTHITGTTTAEAEALAATAALIAAGGDPFGDEDDDTTVAAAEADTGTDTEDEADEQAAAGDEAKPEDEGADEALSAEALEAIAADEVEPEPAATPRYKAGDPAEFKAKREEQITVKAKALKDLMDGVIEPEEYSRIEAEVADALDALTVQRTLHEANTQTEAQTQAQVLDKIMRAAKADGIDYAANGKAARRFDAEMALMDADGDKRPYAERAADAHKTVATLLGKPKATPEPPKEPPKPRETKGPVTLRNVPAAEVPNNGGSWVDALGKLSGQDYEAAYAKLTPAQKAQLLND